MAEGQPALTPIGGYSTITGVRSAASRCIRLQPFLHPPIANSCIRLQPIDSARAQLQRKSGVRDCASLQGRVYQPGASTASMC